MELGRFEWRWLSRLVNETAVVRFGVLWGVPSKMYLIPPTCDRIRPLPIADAMCDATFLNRPKPTERPAHICRLQDEWCLVHAAKWLYVSKTCFSTCFCYFISKFHMAERCTNGTYVCMCCIYYVLCTYVCMYVCSTSCTVHWSKKLQQPGKMVARRSVMISYKQVIIKLFLKINVSCVKEHELHYSVMWI
jgi:hypothetical protein